MFCNKINKNKKICTLNIIITIVFLIVHFYLQIFIENKFKFVEININLAAIAKQCCSVAGK